MSMRAETARVKELMHTAAECLLVAAEDEAVRRFYKETHGNVCARSRGVYICLDQARTLFVSYKLPLYPLPREYGFTYQLLESPTQTTPGRYLSRDEAEMEEQR